MSIADLKRSVDLRALVAETHAIDSSGKTLCPFHDDHRPSLHVYDDGYRCFACEESGDALDWLQKVRGLSRQEAWAEFERLAGVATKSARRIVETYPYTDADGQPLFEVVRYEPKTFRQRRPDGKGGWLWNLNGVEPVLYHLPAVLEAIHEGRSIFLVEGEKDVHGLEAVNLTATTAPGGAGRWRESYSTALTGARVVILPDNDEAGRKHAFEVADALYGRAETVKVLELRDLAAKGDVSDWLDAGGTAAELARLVEETPEFQPQSDDAGLISLADIEPERVDWLWYPYLPLGKLTLLEGDPGLGKTFLALQLAATVSRGAAFPTEADTPGEPGNVLFLSAEDGAADTLRPRLDTAGADVRRIYVPARPSVDLEKLEPMLRQLEPALVVLDPLQAFLGAKVDMHRANEVRPFMTWLSELAERYRSAVLAVRHLTKSGKDRAIYRGLGSIDFAAAVRSILVMGEDPGDDRRRVVVHSKSNLAERGVSLGFEVQGGRFRWTGTSEVTAERLLAPKQENSQRSAVDEAADFLRELLADGPVPAKEAKAEARDAGISHASLRRAKDCLGVTAIRQSLEGKERGSGGWVWSLPKDDAQGEQDEHLEHLEESPSPTPKPQADQGAHANVLDDGGEVTPQTRELQGVQDAQVEPPEQAAPYLPADLQSLLAAFDAGELHGRPLDHELLKHPDAGTYMAITFERLQRHGEGTVLGDSALRDLRTVAEHLGLS